MREPASRFKKWKKTKISTRLLHNPTIPSFTAFPSLSQPMSLQGKIVQDVFVAKLRDGNQEQRLH